LLIRDQERSAERAATAPTLAGHRPTPPALRFLPGIVQFLGYAPWNAGGAIGERLLAYWLERGLSQEALAAVLGVDPGTLGGWERSLRVPTGRLVAVNS